MLPRSGRRPTPRPAANPKRSFRYRFVTAMQEVCRLDLAGLGRLFGPGEVGIVRGTRHGVWHGPGCLAWSVGWVCCAARCLLVRRTCTRNRT